MQKKEKKRFGYTFKKNAEVDAADLQLYEPVERVPPFSRKTLVSVKVVCWPRCGALQHVQVLVGPPGVGRRALVHRIVQHDPRLFDTTKAGQCHPHENEMMSRF